MGNPVFIKKKRQNISKVTLFFKKIVINKCKIFMIECLDPDPVCPERLDPDPVAIRPDPKPCQSLEYILKSLKNDYI